MKIKALLDSNCTIEKVYPQVIASDAETNIVTVELRWPAIVGSLALLGIYVTSRTVGISGLGIEPAGLLDVIVGMLQGGGNCWLIIYSLYQIICHPGMTIGY